MSSSRRYYAVRIGRDGPQLYDNYAEFETATRGLSGSSGKGFDNLRDAQEWLTGYQFGIPTNHQIHTTTANINLNVNLNVNISNSTNLNQGTLAASTSTTVSAAPQQSMDDYDDHLWDSFEDRDFNQLPVISGAKQVKEENTPRPPPPVEEPAIELSDEQKNILELVKVGKNIFFTGPAGTGKSVLLRAIIGHLRSVYGYGPGPEIAITAPTGIAGLNIGGHTIHSWAGIGLGKEPIEKLKRRMRGMSIQRWQKVEALIIDEVSMLDGRLFDKLEALGRHVRQDSRPFGGIQLILTGDFFQLPPVPDQDSTSRIEATFSFQARSWNRCVDRMVKLNQVFRQKDNKFIEMLASMRTGVLEDWHIEEFQKLCRPVHYPDGIDPTLLFPLKGQVERYNLECLNKLPGDVVWYKAMDSRGFDIYKCRVSPPTAEMLLDRTVCPKEVPLKIGAQVMLLRNICQGSLVNGSLGKVAEFITIHDAQERHIAIAEMDKRKDDLPPLTVNPPGADDNVEGLIALNRDTFTKNQLWPLVKFMNGHSLLCSPVEFTVEGLNGNVEARRVQIPLALSWAMSIHKSQGQTLNRVKVDLSRIFEKGQAYVAISRATSMEGLEIVHFDPEKVMAHPDVIAWQAQWDEHRNQEEEMDSEWAVSQWHNSFHE